MSAPLTPPSTGGHPWYRREPWLVVAAASIVPLGIAAVAPPALRAALVGLTALLFVAACVLLVRQGLFRDAPRRDASS